MTDTKQQGREKKRTREERKHQQAHKAKENGGRGRRSRRGCKGGADGGDRPPDITQADEQWRQRASSSSDTWNTQSNAKLSGHINKKHEANRGGACEARAEDVGNDDQQTDITDFTPATASADNNNNNTSHHSIHTMQT